MKNLIFLLSIALGSTAFSVVKPPSPGDLLPGERVTLVCASEVHPDYGYNVRVVENHQKRTLFLVVEEETIAGPQISREKAVKVVYRRPGAAAIWRGPQHELSVNFTVAPRADGKHVGYLYETGSTVPENSIELLCQ